MALLNERNLAPQVKGIMSYFSKEESEIALQTKGWIPKNPEVKMSVVKETPLTDIQWQQSDFPSSPIPSEVTTHVNIEIWEKKLCGFKEDKSLAPYAPLLQEVCSNLKHGCDSMVQPPGTDPTKSRNHFPDPSIDIPRIADAITSKIKAQN